MNENLTIIRYPDPRLKKVCEPITQFDADLKALADQMFVLMRTAKGVGLAAPQVGITKRLFVMNHTGEPGDDRVYVNPVLTTIDGEYEAEEGCLSLPDIHINVIRANKVRLDAQDLEGNPVSVEKEGFEARVWQHETDHLLGVMLTDRMSFTDKMKHRRRLKELSASFEKKKK
jgi:peptide deformylase